MTTVNSGLTGFGNTGRFDLIEAMFYSGTVVGLLAGREKCGNIDESDIQKMVESSYLFKEIHEQPSVIATLLQEEDAAIGELAAFYMSERNIG